MGIKMHTLRNQIINLGISKSMIDWWCTFVLHYHKPFTVGQTHLQCGTSAMSTNVKKCTVIHDGKECYCICGCVVCPHMPWHGLTRIVHWQIQTLTAGSCLFQLGDHNWQSFLRKGISMVKIWRHVGHQNKARLGGKIYFGNAHILFNILVSIWLGLHSIASLNS